jgi:DNA (cytosine-5)-methyltransferase 1
MFCGAGGSSAGARSAGVKITRGIDAWDLATLTFKDNFAKAEVTSSNLVGRASGSMA